jgi:hypothetical protein
VEEAVLHEAPPPFPKREHSKITAGADERAPQFSEKKNLHPKLSNHKLPTKAASYPTKEEGKGMEGGSALRQEKKSPHSSVSAKAKKIKGNLTKKLKLHFIPVSSSVRGREDQRKCFFSANSGLLLC